MAQVDYIIPGRNMCGSPDPYYDQRESTLDDLSESYNSLDAAWGYLYDALKDGADYLDENLDELREIENDLFRLKKKLEGVLRIYRP